MITKKDGRLLEMWVDGRRTRSVGTESVSELKELEMLTVLFMMVVSQIHIPEKIHQIML